MYIENLREHWREHILHLGIGVLAGVLLTTGQPTAGGVLMGVVCARQALEFAKRRDTPGIDLAYYVAGLLVGIVIGWMA